MNNIGQPSVLWGDGGVVSTWRGILVNKNPIHLFLPSALCFLLFFFFFFLWLSTVAASAVCCSLAMKFSMSSKQWLRIPWGRENQFVMLFRREWQRGDWKKKKERWRGGVPLLSLLAGRRYRARRSCRSLSQKRGEDSVHSFSFMALVFAEFRNSCPLCPWNPPPLYTHTHTNTQSNLCAPKYLSLHLLLLRVKSLQILLQISVFFTQTCMWKLLFFFLTSESGVRWRVGWWGIWSMCDGGAWDVIGDDHLSPTLRKPKGREESFNPATHSQHCTTDDVNILPVDDVRHHLRKHALVA